MATYGFASTSLWKSTLAPREVDPDAEHRDYLRSVFIRTRETVGLLLGELARGAPEYTVHDLTHADALWETASLLTGSEVGLNPAEGFVLGLAFLLHDAAMGQAAYQGGLVRALGEDRWGDLICSAFYDRNGRWPTDAERAEPPTDVVSAAASAAIREAHAEQAGVLVDMPWVGSGGAPYFLLDDARLRDWCGEVLADLVRSHWWSVDRVSSHFGQQGSAPWLPDWPLDPLKLACLLRLADATQIDARRAPTLLLLIRGPEGESARHWRFQQYVTRPGLHGDRITYTSSRPFAEADAPAWWLALDYLRSVDDELRKVDDLMHDLSRPRFAARGVTGVATPARFARVFPPRNWRPLDTDVRVSDARGLVAALGGEQLYGREPETALRELLQNAHDAVAARRFLEPDFDGSIRVMLSTDGSGRVLTVRDDGVGMDEDILVDGLMDFGRSGWRTRMVQQKWPGLIGRGFRPRGRFGVGFYSVFMLGARVEVVSRRYDQGHDAGRRITFDGLAARPLMTPLADRQASPAGTTVTVHLDHHPYASKGGLIGTGICESFPELVQRLVPESDVPVQVLEAGRPAVTLPPFRPATSEAAAVFDRLYPTAEDNWTADHLRGRLRTEFVECATELRDPSGQRIGLAMVASEISRWMIPTLYGVTTVNGFLADRLDFFTGYLEGRATRASRDQAELVATDDAVREWLSSQVETLRRTKRFSVKRQFELADMLIRAGLELEDDHHVALTGRGPLAVGDIERWAAHRDEVVLSSGWPLSWSLGGPYGAQIWHTRTGEQVHAPDGWVFVMHWGLPPELERVLDDRRDPRYAAYRFDRPTSWQRRWWDYSDNVQGIFITQVARAWSCDIEDLLAPPAARRWNDTAQFIDVRGTAETATVLRLRRPVSGGSEGGAG